jgi:lipid-binding SYLF domain-containing protein
MGAFYGHEVSSHRVLRGEVETPAAAVRFIDAVKGAKVQAHASN